MYVDIVISNVFNLNKHFFFFALRASEVRHLLLDFDPYGSTVPFGLFLHFLNRISDLLNSRTSVVL